MNFKKSLQLFMITTLIGGFAIKAHADEPVTNQAPEISPETKVETKNYSTLLADLNQELDAIEASIKQKEKQLETDVEEFAKNWKICPNDTGYKVLLNLKITQTLERAAVLYKLAKDSGRDDLANKIPHFRLVLKQDLKFPMHKGERLPLTHLNSFNSISYKDADKNTPVQLKKGYTIDLRQMHYRNLTDQNQAEVVVIENDQLQFNWNTAFGDLFAEFGVKALVLSDKSQCEKK